MSAETVSIFVAGLPITQGSKSVDPTSGRSFDQNFKRLRPWRKAIVDTAKAQLGPDWRALDGPLRVEAVFAFPRPASHPKRRRTWPTYKKDIDKLQRALFDALTIARVYLDDGQLVEVHVWKDWCGPDIGVLTPGVLVTVYRIETPITEGIPS